MLKRTQDPLRKLARSSQYQVLYVRAKELGCIHLFENTSDLSRIQMEFLYWIALYNRLYQDLAMGEDCLTEEIIDDDLLCDCYLIWEEKVKRKREKDSLKNPNKYSKSKSIKRQIDHSASAPSVVFTR